MYSKRTSPHHKNNYLQSKATVAFAIVSIALTLGLGFYLRPFFYEKSAVAGHQALSQPTPNAQLDVKSWTEVDVETDNLSEKSAPDNTSIATTPSSRIQSQEVKGVTLVAANFRMEKNQLMIDTCFDLPDDGDWIIWDASLKLGTQELNYSGSIFMETPFEPASSREQRCDTIYFEHLPSNADFSNAVFIVEGVLAYPREGQVCDPEYLAKYQKALDERNTGITVECFNEELDGGGMSGVRVASKSDSMSQEEANAILHDYDFFLDVHGISGPWTFPFSLDP